MVENLPAIAGDVRSTPGSGRSLGEENCHGLHRLGKNFQTRGRMRGEYSLLEWEMLLEQ